MRRHIIVIRRCACRYGSMVLHDVWVTSAKLMFLNHGVMVLGFSASLVVRLVHKHLDQVHLVSRVRTNVM